MASYQKLKSRIEAGINTSYSKGASFTNGERNDIYTSTIGPNVSYNFSIDDKIDLSFDARVALSNSKYSCRRRQTTIMSNKPMALI